MKRSIGTAIGGGFGLGLFLLALLGLISYFSTARLINTANNVTHTYEVLGKLDELLQSLTNAETGQRGYVITGEASYLEPYNLGISQVSEDIQALRQLTVDNPTQQTRLDTLAPLVASKLEVLQQTIDVRNSDGFEAAQGVVLNDTGKQLMDQIRVVIDQMKAEENRLLAERDTNAKASANFTQAVITFGIPLSFVLLALVAFYIVQSITRPLSEMTRTAQTIAAGDLSVNVNPDNREDEIGLLATAFRQMILSLRSMAETADRIATGDLTAQVKPQSDKDVLGNAFALMLNNLRQVMTELREAVNVLASSASEILASTTQVASGAAETATAVSETTTTVEEVKQTAEMSTQKARYVSETAQKSVQVSQTGKQSVGEMVLGMTRIREQVESIAESIVRLSEQSQMIGEITTTVNDLAEQSNLLSVNAAIEAAKAGEQGKGFTVVAQEIKSLAEQSKQATAQVRTILSDVQKATSAAVMATEQGGKAVDSGTRQSTAAGESIRALAESIAEAAQAATQIAASNQQQLAGMDQVVQAMENIKTASTQNVASTKQAEVAARGLHDLGQKLKVLIERYKL